jgi:hypothetical protein
VSHLNPKELSRAIVCALMLALVTIGQPLWDSDTIYLATDTAAVQAPWSAPGTVQNSELSDSGVAFYPHYRRVSEAWRGAGKPPLWNPDIYVGVPLLANPQWGVLDPQVLLLVVLDALGGQRLFDLGFAWMAFLRIAAAALGAYLLARRLGLQTMAAAFSAASFSLSGSLTLWLGFSLAHVTPLLPWVLLGVEALRSTLRPARAFLLIAITLALAIYGGHPEVAFFVGLTAGGWSFSLLGESRRRFGVAIAALLCGVLLATPLLLPFVEYLQNSGALVAHQLAPSAREVPDLLALGALLFFGGFLKRWRKFSAQAEFSAVIVALPIALGLLGFLIVSTGRGAQLDLGLAQSASIESGSVRLSFATLGLFLVALYSGVGGLPRARWLLAIGITSWMLSSGFSAVVDIWRWIPLVGLSAPERAGCSSALFLSLVAGMALERTGSTGRWAAVLSLLALVIVAEVRGRTQPMGQHLARIERPHEVISYTKFPPRVLEEGNGFLAGVLHGSVDLDELRLRFESLDTEGGVLSSAGFERIGRLSPTDVPGETAFDFGELELRSLGSGDWRLVLDFRRDDTVFSQRKVAMVHVPGSHVWNALGLGLGVLTCLVLIVARGRRGQWLLLVVTITNGVVLARDWNPAVPRAQHFGPAQTLDFIDEHLAGERFLAEPGILPGDTVLLTQASTINGYDAMDVASFDGYRSFALKRGMNPLLDWNARGMDLTSSAFRLFGVRALLFHERANLADWSLVAGPKGADAETELYIYLANDAIPRAFCVGQVLSLSEALEDPEQFDPRTHAFVEDSFSFGIDRPFSDSRVQQIERSAELLTFEVQLDGEGLFISTEQHFPGWRATVDGEPREILRVDSIFRGVLLDAGTHRVRFEYKPESWKLGKLLGLLGLLLTGLGAWFVTRRPLA